LRGKVGDEYKIWIAVDISQIDYLSLNRDVTCENVKFGVDGINQLKLRFSFCHSDLFELENLISKLKESKNEHLKIDLEISGFEELNEDNHGSLLKNILSLNINLLKLVHINSEGSKISDTKFIDYFKELKSVKQLEIQYFKEEEQRFFDQFKLYKLHDLDLLTPDPEDLSTYTKFIEAFFTRKLLPQTSRLKYFVTVE
jgi:hypothetical protein